MNENWTKQRSSFNEYCHVFLGQIFRFCPDADQIRVVQAIEHVVLKGGVCTQSLRRGKGATSYLSAAAMWATSYYHRDFVVYLTANDAMASSVQRFVLGSMEAILGMEQIRRSGIYLNLPKGRAIAFCGVESNLIGLTIPIKERPAWWVAARLERPDLVLVDNLFTAEDTEAVRRNKEAVIKQFPWPHGEIPALVRIVASEV